LARPILLGLVPVACLALTGCGHTPAEAPAPTSLTVTVSHPLQRMVRDYEYYLGRTASVDALQVRARVSGYLE
jgi:multidrug efflux system membrane fusion protein